MGSSARRVCRSCLDVMPPDPPPAPRDQDADADYGLGFLGPFK